MRADANARKHAKRHSSQTATHRNHVSHAIMSSHHTQQHEGVLGTELLASESLTRDQLLRLCQFAAQTGTNLNTGQRARADRASKNRQQRSFVSRSDKPLAASASLRAGRPCPIAREQAASVVPLLRENGTVGCEFAG